MGKQKNAATREVEIYLPHLFAALLRKSWLMVLGGMLGAVILFLSTYFFEPVQYRSSTMFYVNNSNTIYTGDLGLGGTSASGISLADRSASKNLVFTYIAILKTRESVEDIIDYSGIDATYEEVQDMISAAPVEDTEIFRVYVSSSDPVETQELANAIAYVLPKRIATIVEGSSAQIVEASVTAASRSGPNYEKSGKTGFLAGFLVTMMIVATAYAMDTAIHTEDDLTRYFSAALLSAIPDMTAGLGKKQPLVGNQISFAAAEGYKLLRTKLEFSFADEGGCHIIGVTSAAAGEGKTTTAANLACNFADLGRRVLLVDCDMRLPSMHEKLPVRRNPGLSEFLTGQRTEAEVIQACASEGNHTFHLIAAGRVPPNPMELLGSARMSALLEQMREQYDHILLDLPPVGEVGDALTAAKLADGMLVVVQQNKTDRKSLNSALRQLHFVDSRILGLVLNKQKQRGIRFLKATPSKVMDLFHK